MRMAAALGGATIFDYCERGGNPAFWAEPLNAVTNAGFIAAAVAGIVLVAQRPPEARSLWQYFFIVNFIAIGIGSFLFHTVPNPRTAVADTGPIGIFMVSYFTFGLRRLARFPMLYTVAALAAFVACLYASMAVKCFDGRVGFLDDLPAGAQGRCFNGSLGYAPALAAIWAIGGWLLWKRLPAGRTVLAAGCIFLVSLCFRSVDISLCNGVTVGGHKLGTHFIWHILNSLTLFLLMLAAIRHGGARHRILPPRPAAGQAIYAGRR